MIELVCIDAIIMIMTNIYLDIDGVILANEYNLAEGAADFIKFITDNFEVYWLTTQCMNGDPSWAIEYINRASSEDLKPWLQKIRPTKWIELKTEAIDFSKPFFWLDDDLFEGEKSELENNHALESFMLVNLHKNSRDLIDKKEILKYKIEEPTPS